MNRVQGHQVQGPQDHTPPSLAAAQALVGALIEARVRSVAYCPGSRNAPLAYALAAAEASGQVQVNIFPDERGAAFWALGAAKANQGARPVVVVTTSGTAAAEVLPAVEEALHQGLPLIAVTADRPFDLVAVGASQTTRQAGLLARSVVANCDIPASAPATGITNRVRRVLARALGFGGRPGPAHINVAFADPLTPGDIDAYLQTPLPGVPPWPLRLAEFSPSALPTWEEVVDPTLRTVVVAGGVEAGEADVARTIVAEAAARGVPVLAEPTSNLTDCATWIPHQPWVIGMLAGQVQQLIVLGKPTLSRAVTRLLGAGEVRKIVISTHDQWPDLAGGAALIVPGLQASPHKDADLPLLPVDPLLAADPQWLALWRDAACQVENVLAEHEQMRPLDHATLARAVWSHSAGTDLWLGASGVIRAFDLAAGTPGRDAMFSNRGLAGIDGTIAAARGLRSVRQRPLRVVLGDLTFNYDLNSLTVPADPGEDVQVIVLDDGGGSIFASLEHGRAPEPMYEKFFAAAPNLDVVAAAKACRWEAQRVDSLEGLIEVLATPPKGRSVICVPMARPAPLWERLAQQILEGS